MSGKTKNKEQEDIFAENIEKFSKNYHNMLQKYFESAGTDFTTPWLDIYKSCVDATAKALENPEELQKKQAGIFNDYLHIWNNSLARYMGEDLTPLYQPNPKDRRFRDSTWNNDLIFDFLKQSYIFTRKWADDFIHNMENIDEKTRHKIEFYSRQFFDALSPSNFALTNPEVIRETINSNGENLVKGLKNFVKDLERSKHFLNVSTSNDNHFRLGKNIATCKGKVIYKNELMELIQYEPLAEKNYETPLLIIPAWINKYYIFDLSEDNSLVKWLCEKGYTVFIISWVNPDESHAHKKFEDYMKSGPLAALEAIEKATGSGQVNAMGYCLGGTTLACALAYMKAKGEKRVKAATMLTTMLDFQNSGDLSLFMDEEYVKYIEKHMSDTGYLSGEEMAAIFNSLRANDMIWSFVVNNYLMGREPFPFDILYWNSDSTRLPAEAHSFYLRKLYLENALLKKGGLTLCGVNIDVKAIDTPLYILSTQDDHIAPWRNTYTTTQLIKKGVKFVLAASGHVAGVINPPAKNKYCYWQNNELPQSLEEWFNKAQKTNGSWWENWHEWNASYSGKMIPAPKPGAGKLKPLADAPGEYVKVK